MVRTYGPDPAALCQAGTALMPDIAGLGLSAGRFAGGPPAGSTPHTRFSSDATGSLLEAAQYTLDEGPCRDAAATRAPVLAADLTGASWTRRWPRFTPAALRAGIKAVHALPLRAGAVRHDGAIDLYHQAPGQLDSPTAERTAVAFAAAVTELLTLERLNLDFTEAFAAGRLGDTLLDLAAGKPINGPAALVSDTPGLPLARWFNRTTLPIVRRQVAVLSFGHGLTQTAGSRWVLAVHEAMTNAVWHGGGQGQLLMWRRDGRLWCEISDHGPGIGHTTEPGCRPDPRSRQPERRGLWLIEQACTSLDITTDTTGSRLLLSHRLDRHQSA
ncbi:ATP-binding protein [Actinoplanes sp. NPDC051346]|uniref:ATP-binding protein n=1 Tax=Actinoplanes sp. NPDC051346 TaxID=3155048 RepID=UPI00343F10DB